ncbi:MAG: hypothetical protein ABIN91_09680 [Mucilaginibacter sp.]|uniref:XAC2610-related protein n=1 Tax=Mucilaginibacter sp. TaxID=1882438 RepID=UPI00326314AB
MKRLFSATILSIILLVTINVYGQVTFAVDGFSTDFSGKIYISDTSQVFSKGWVEILDKKTKKQLIRVNSDELTFELHNGKLLANIKQSPYGEQSSIIYQDFNFDGKYDFAIMDGQNSCYHGPSYQVYLATANGFKLSADFTRLAQEYCGMFDADTKTKQITTMTKSGCCWHQYSLFIVQDNKPKAIKITEDDETNIPYSIYSEENWNGKKMVRYSKKNIDLTQEGVKPILTFTVDKNGKQIALFNLNNRTLNYAVISKENTVEFSYPITIVYQNPDFTFNSERNVLTFKNKNATYTIIEQDKNVTLQTNINGKAYTWVGNAQTKKGALHQLLTTRLDNVVIN